MIKTTEKILDTAEDLFSENGYSATSLRSITQAAGVNLAAIHYHFHSKDALLDAVIARRAEVMNRERSARLDECERRAGDGQPALEPVLEAFLIPVFELANHSRRGRVFVKLMSRVHSEAELFSQILQKHFSEVATRFAANLRRALPELSPEDLFLRLNFVMGAVLNALSGPRLVEALPGGHHPAPDGETVAARLIEFVAA